MTTTTIQDLMDTWSRRALDTAVGERSRDGFSAAVLDLLADATPALPVLLASRTGLDPDEVHTRIERAAATGYEVQDGAIVGAALTLKPTQHRFRVRGNDLFTWCGFDALFLPIMLREQAQVVSTCPSPERASR